MNALLGRVVQFVLVCCGLILVIMAMDVGSSEHPTAYPGVIILGTGILLICMQNSDPAWSTPITHPLAFLFSCAGYAVSLNGCWGLMVAVAGYFRVELGDWFGSLLRVCAGLAIVRLGTNFKDG